MNTLPPAGHVVAEERGSAGASGLERVLGWLSVVSLLMTLPQVLAVWVRGDARGVSLASWATYLLVACLWFVHGVRKRDKTIYLACVGWILIDSAIVIGVLFYG